MQWSIQDITGITVSHNTRHYLEKAVGSVRSCHPDLKLIIIDGSTYNSECYNYVTTLANEITTVAICKYNIGHGRGMDTGLKMCKTKFALVFDSDIVMKKSPVIDMLQIMEPDTYGVGWCEKTGFDGFEYGAHSHHKSEGFMRMLHPYFMLLQVSEYFKFHPFVHHGAPCYMAALDIHRRGLTDKIIKVFPGLGHSGGEGWTWKGEPREYIDHVPGGTRYIRKRAGQSEIEGKWTYANKQQIPANRSLRNRWLNK